MGTFRAYEPESSGFPGYQSQLPEGGSLNLNPAGIR
jgi:hypothetical protein